MNVVCQGQYKGQGDISSKGENYNLKNYLLNVVIIKSVKCNNEKSKRINIIYSFKVKTVSILIIFISLSIILITFIIICRNIYFKHQHRC